jgi:hypothetical protein
VVPAHEPTERRGGPTAPKFIFTYHQPAGYVPGSDSDAMAAWEGFFAEIADSVADPGQPVFARTALGEVGSSTQLGGYSVINAEDFEHAIALAKACPTLSYGGGVQVGLLAELPPDHAASRLKERVTQA